MNYNKSFENFIRKSHTYEDLYDFVMKSDNICPLKENVFRFMYQDISKAKVIILGMDPYSSTYEKDGVEVPVATGRSFEVANVERWTDSYRQVSLTNIFKALAYKRFGEIYTMNELRSIVNEKIFRYINIHDWFDAMEKEGVVFLNATLTTIMHKTGAHINVWARFMDELIKYIVDSTKDIKWLIWGESARKRVFNLVDDKNIVYTCHPASRVKNTFVKDCCFEKILNVNWV